MVSAETTNAQTLDYWTFVDFAVTKTAEIVPEVDPIAMRLVLELHRVANAVVYDLESTVHRPSGWTWSGFRLLFVLWLVGPSESKQIAALSGHSRSATSAMVKTLAKDDLVSVKKSSSDGRAVTIELTARGQQMIAETFTTHNQREQMWVEALSPPERLVLIGLLTKLGAGAADRDAVKRR